MLSALSLVANAHEANIQQLMPNNSNRDMCLRGIVSKHIPANEIPKRRYKSIGVHGPHILLEKDLTSMPSIECPIPNKSIDWGLFPIGSEILIYGVVKTNTDEGGWLPSEEFGKKNSIFKYECMDQL